MTKKKKPEELIPKHLKESGRPTMYNANLAQKICDLVASCDYGYNRLAQLHDDLPERITVNIWRRKYPEFAAMYTSAKSAQIEFLTEEILEIADDGKNDYMQNCSEEEGYVGWKVNGEHIARSRLRIDTRKWLAAKLVPRLYGDHKHEEIANTDLHEDTMKRKQELDERNRKDH
jgi:hypothetical protein